MEQVDSPVAPGYRGSTRFLRGISDEMRQNYRVKLFQVDRESLVSTARRYVHVFDDVYTYT